MSVAEQRYKAVLAPRFEARGDLIGALFEPFGHELGTDMNVDLPKTPRPRIGELVSNPGSDDHDLAGNGLHGLRTGHESWPTFQDHEHLFIWMPVKARAFTGSDVHEYERHGGAAVVESLQL